VGANVGDSVAVLRAQAQFPILCVEADARFFDLLQRNAQQFSDVALVHAYLGEAPSQLSGRLRSAEGTGHVDATSAADNGGAGETISIRTLCQVLADHPAFAAAKLIKIDTDGYDCKILRGAAPCLARSKPVLFFEYDPYFLSRQGDDGISVFQTLRELGYRDLLVYDNLGNLIGPANMGDPAQLTRIHNEYCDHRPGGRYVDLCAFHGDDADAFAAALSSESEHFRGAAARPK
jgi:FkbM family methyltransferase